MYIFAVKYPKLIAFIFIGFLLVVACIVAYAIYNRNKIVKIKEVELKNTKGEVIGTLPKKDLIHVKYRGMLLFMDEKEYSVWFHANRQQRNQLFKLAMKGKNLITRE